MDDYKTKIREKWKSLLIYGKLYKKELAVLTVIIMGALLWGAFNEDDEKERHLPSEMQENLQHLEVNNEPISKKGHLIYDINSTLRSMPWREVLTSNGEDILEGESKDEEMKVRLTSELKKSISVNEKSRRNHKDATDIELSRGSNSSIAATNHSSYNGRRFNDRKTYPQEAFVAGIIVGEMPYVVIAIGLESKMMTIGDNWKSFSIVDINQQCVTFDKGGQTICVEVGESLSL